MAYLLEIIACSLEDAAAAAQGGADRLELCVRLDVDGLTPPVDMVAAITAQVAIPVRVMIRTETQDLAVLRQQVQEMSALPIQGIVLGLLDNRGRLDFTAMDRVLDAAPAHWAWTLHHAFDAARGPLERKLALVMAHGRADRILHPARPAELAKLVLQAGEGIRIVAGGGLTAANLSSVISSGCREFHFGSAARGVAVEAAKVRRLKDLLR
jgi:copper homeostasis protein